MEKIKWSEKVTNEEIETTQKNFNYKPKGRRNIGRPQTRCEDDFLEEGTGQGA